ncbi:hypothetical protein DICPUDRAFT_74203 [Dictyostelium purpureum]|uniref:Uncharacterized protein n=1 Tax=Dictyostelium purpureum TaxID=5786 RepID=F0Z731_DICPU|nr:uncharacterized protein DICPUDRAFT_74203 [Dictyostelium purpureum]EGC40264.1 hypothetical protein DICPUDRAFT_74203 [Dictyostelium purpureum]|eukprot:XP_003283200.1 hypothetical protein DICPUDRAFT_74203 [Dictyostelium purpureum]
MDFLNIGSFSFVIIICLLLGFLYKCLNQIEDLKKQNQQQANKELENNYPLTIFRLNNELSGLEVEKRVHHDHLSALAKKQEVLDQKNKSELEKLSNLKNVQSLEIKQYQTLANQQRQILQGNDIEQYKLVEERDSIKAKLENQFRKSNVLEETLSKKDEIIQMLEKKLLSEQLAVVQLSCEHKQAMDKLNLRS